MDTLNKVLTLAQEKGADLSRLPIEVPNTDRVSLAGLFSNLGFTKGVEVGTEQGKYAETLLDRNPKLFLSCVDPWEAYSGYREHVSQDKLNNFYEITENRLAPYGKQRFELLRGFSLDVVKHFSDNSLDFVYIDANHTFSEVVADITAWYPKVRPGGIISGHDFIRKKNINFGVVDAVTGYTRSNAIEPWFVLGRKDRIGVERRDRSRSWFWVKI